MKTVRFFGWVMLACVFSFTVGGIRFQANAETSQPERNIVQSNEHLAQDPVRLGRGFQLAEFEEEQGEAPEIEEDDENVEDYEAEEQYENVEDYEAEEQYEEGEEYEEGGEYEEEDQGEEEYRGDQQEGESE